MSVPEEQSQGVSMGELALWRSRFDRLRAGWEVLHEERRTRGRQASIALIDSWDQQLQALKGDVARLKREGLWLHGRSDFLGVMGMGRDERRHSRLIAWLLDPLGRHGLGSRFLNRLLATCFPGVDFGDTELARTQCEVARGGRLADIVVWLPWAMVVIEVKVDAPEGGTQCDDLCREFAGDIEPHFVFLTPTGRPPERSVGEGLEKFKPLRFQQLREMLQSVLGRNGPSGEGRHIAEDYVSTLEREFG